MNKLVKVLGVLSTIIGVSVVMIFLFQIISTIKNIYDKSVKLNKKYDNFIEALIYGVFTSENGKFSTKFSTF